MSEAVNAMTDPVRPIYADPRASPPLAPFVAPQLNFGDSTNARQYDWLVIKHRRMPVLAAGSSGYVVLSPER